jgi:hypothetical protein
MSKGPMNVYLLEAALFPATLCDIAIRDESSHDEPHRNTACA